MENKEKDDELKSPFIELYESVVKNQEGVEKTQYPFALYVNDSYINSFQTEEAAIAASKEQKELDTDAICDIRPI